MKERLKTSGRHEKYELGKKCQEDLILGRQAFKWSLESSCFNFQLKTVWVPLTPYEFKLVRNTGKKVGEREARQYHQFLL